MVARKFLVHHNESQFHVDYDTDDGLEVLQFQLYSLTSVPPHGQKIFGEQNTLISKDSDLDAITEELHLVSIGEEELPPPSSSDAAEAAILTQSDEELPPPSSSDAAEAAILTQSDEELARMLQAEEEALLFQQFSAGEDQKEFEARIRPHVANVLRYEDQVRQEAARKTVPVEELEEKALVALAKEGNFKPSKVEEDHAFLLQLLFWFKQSFRWVNAPPCDSCGGETNNIGMGVPLSSEVQFGGSGVELYRCHGCSGVTRFPRYNDPLKLLETRRGRCGEWANCFTFYCRAFGYDSRLVLDFTDHVWTECFSHCLGRWMHLDPCEGVYDNPLLYEKGWKKNLTYAIGIGKDGVHDVIKRYTRKWHEVLRRRNITTEPVASAVLSDITKECRKALSSHELSMLEYRDRKEAEELERELYFENGPSILLPGRQSGAMEWRLARSELGSDSLSSSACPLRACVDDHVSNIYNAISVLLSQMVNNGISKDAAIKILKALKTLLLNLRSTPFRVRKATFNADPDVSPLSMLQIMASIDGLLASLSLKRETETGGRTLICLDGDPVKTSLALPVALDALDNSICNVNNVKSFVRESLILPLVKFDRISSGFVLASGEELPFGIATSAFDGTYISKWEEPNGAKGCSIIYKTRDGKMHDLEAYELTSANDAPERDPMDWIVEGSTDGGSSWNVLDERTSQMFEERFQRKTFKVESVRIMSNAFRFKFLAVCDSNATSRFQIGSIDLYAKAN